MYLCVLDQRSAGAGLGPPILHPHQKSTCMCRYQSVLQMRRAMQEFARVARGYSRRSAAAIKVQVSNCKVDGSGLQSCGSAGERSVQVAMRLAARQLKRHEQ